MITETITYKDFPDENGVQPEVTETLYFNISTSELTENLSLKDDLEEIMRIVDSSGGERTLEIREVQKIVDFVKTMMKLAYGERKTDPVSGRKLFVKEGRWECFQSSAAYDKFIMTLFENPEKAMNFIVKVLPKEIVEAAAKEQGIEFDGDNLQIPEDFRPKPVHPMAMAKTEPALKSVPEPEDRIAVLKSKKRTELTRDELLELMEHQNRQSTGQES